MQSDKRNETEFLNRIDEHQGLIHKVCIVYANRKNDYEDLFQEITLQLWKSYASFAGKSSFSTWMYKVALNTAISQTKKIFQQTEIDDRGEVLEHPDIEMDMNEELRILYQAISKLKKTEKAIILLWLEERSYDEIAETLGISVKNVSVKLVRVKGKLTELIQKMMK